MLPFLHILAPYAYTTLNDSKIIKTSWLYSSSSLQTNKQTNWASSYATTVHAYISHVLPFPTKSRPRELQFSTVTSGLLYFAWPRSEYKHSGSVCSALKQARAQQPNSGHGLTGFSVCTNYHVDNTGGKTTITSAINAKYNPIFETDGQIQFFVFGTLISWVPKKAIYTLQESTWFGCYSKRQVDDYIITD